MSSIFTPEGSRFVRLHEKTIDWLGLGSGMITFAIAVITVLDIIGRSSGAFAIPSAYEICQYLLLWLAFVGVSYAQARGGNIRVEIVINRFGAKAKEALLILALLVGLFIFGMILWSNIEFTAISIRSAEYMTGIKEGLLWPWKIMVPIGCFFLCVEFILEIGRAVYRLRGGSS